MKPECSGTMWGGWSRVRCTRTGKYERSGKHYCGICDPVRKEEKRKKKLEKWERKRKAEHAVWIIKCEIKDLLERHPDFTEARRRLDEAEVELHKVISQ